MTSPLPAGVRLWIWPRYAIEVDGIKVKLGRVQGRMLTLLITSPNKLWTMPEIIDALYEDHEDGGPLQARKIVYTRTKCLIDKLAEHGIVLELEIVGETRRLARIHATPGMPAPAPPPAPPPASPPTFLPRPSPSFAAISMRYVMPARNPDRPRFLIRKFRSFAQLRRVARKRNLRDLDAAGWEQRHSPPVYESPDEAPWHFPARIEAAEQRKAAAAKRSGSSQ